MARSRGVWRLCFGWCLLLCILPTVEAGSKNVPVPGAAAIVEGAGSATLSGGSLQVYSAPLEGVYIEAATKNVPVRGILGGAEYGLNTIKGAARGLIRGGVPAIIASVAIDQLLKGLDWAVKDGAVVKKVPAGPTVYTPGVGQYYWETSGSPKLSSAGAACDWLLQNITSGWPNPTLSFSMTSASSAHCVLKSDDWHAANADVTRQGNFCPDGLIYSDSQGACVSSQGSTTALTDQDFINMDDWINNRDSDYVKSLLKQACVGSNNPNGCYESLRQRQLDLKGPATVDAGTTTSTTTHPNADGTTSTTTTTTNNKYNLTYSPSTITYTNHSTTTTSTDGKPGDTTTTDEQPSDEADPEDSDDDTKPSPCAGNGCDGPAYTKLYEPTKDTKEKFLDSYASKVKSLPILSAASGFFTVTASAGCPAWSTTVSFDVFGYSFNTNLVFDFHCQPWFVSMAAYAKIVMSIVCAYLAFRQAILD